MMMQPGDDVSLDSLLETLEHRVSRQTVTETVTRIKHYHTTTEEDSDTETDQQYYHHSRSGVITVLIQELIGSFVLRITYSCLCCLYSSATFKYDDL